MKFSYQILTFIFLFLFATQLDANQNINDINHIKHKYSLVKIQKNNLDSIYFYGIKLIENYKALNNYQKAINIYDELLNLSLENDDIKKYAEFSLQTSELLTYQSNYSLALKYTLNALDKFQKLQDNYGLAKTYNTLSILYYYLTHFPKAKRFALMANQLSLKLNDKILLSENYNNLAIIYSSIDSIKTSQEYNYKSLKIKQDLKDSIGIAKTLANIALNYLKNNDIDLAIEFYDKSLEILKKHNDKRSIVLISVNLGYCYLMINDTKSAINIANKMNVIIENANLVDLKALYYIFNSEISKQKNDFKSAYQYLENYLSIKDSIFTNETHDKIRELEELITTKNENLNLIKENKEHYLWFSIISILSLIIIISFYLKYLSNKKSKRLLEEKNNKILEQNLKLDLLNKELTEANKSKDKLFNILAHDLKNPIWWSKNISEILTTNIDKLSKEKIKEIAQVLDDSANTSLHLIDNILQWSKAQMNRIEFIPETFKIKTQIELILEHLKINYITKNIKVTNNINSEVTIYADKNMFNTIFRNILSNAFKFTNNAGTVEINYFEDDGKQKIIVKDNGIGIDKKLLKKLFINETILSSEGTANEKGSGLGLMLTKEFVDRHNAELIIESEINVGTTIIVKFPKRNN